MAKKTISVVIPCFNEQENILAMYDRLKQVFKLSSYTYEFVFVNNGSTDTSEKIFTTLAKKDRHVVVVNLSRSFYGSQGSYTAGLDTATGDAVVLIDGDLQDPPGLIPKFIKKWESGYQIVYGVRHKRRGSTLLNLGYKLFYKVFSSMSYIEIPRNVGDFSLLDRVVVDHIKAMPERNRLIRGLRAWVGFKNIGIAYTRHERVRGKSTMSMLANFRWAAFAIFSFSYSPLSFISWLAIFVVALSTIAIVIYVILYFLFPGTPKGIPTIIILVLFMGSVQLVCFSIIAQYLAIMFDEIKGRPKYIVKNILNKPHATPSDH